MQQAIALAPSSAWAYAVLADMRVVAGQPDKVIAAMQESFQLDPQPPSLVRFKKTTSKKKAATKTQSKMSKCVEIMVKNWNAYCDDKIQRKDILEMFMKQAGLSKAGASTYLLPDDQEPDRQRRVLSWTSSMSFCMQSSVD